MKNVATSSEILPETGKEEVSEIYESSFSFDEKQARYIKLTARNYGSLPEWHLGFPYQGTAWIFADEISVE